MAGTKRKISEVEDVETQPIPSVKNLASSDPKQRRQALLEILSHFKDRNISNPLTKVQCEQIWKAFHVLVYMHDSKNTISVQNMLQTLADTFRTIHEKDQLIFTTTTNTNTTNATKKVSSGTLNDEDEFKGFDDQDQDHDQDHNVILNSWLSIYTTAFWTTMVREWNNIDSHRVNKYLLLIRLVTRVLLGICVDPISDPSTSLSVSESELKKISKKSKTKGKDENEEESIQAKQHQSRYRAQVSTTLTDLFSLYPMNGRDVKIPMGLRLHLLDVYVDELDVVLTAKVLEETQTGLEQDRTEVLEILKQPLLKLLDASDRRVRNRAKEEIEEFESRVERRE